jgi:ABC-type nitrate/sulfonate/bicarbonate transport system substrate-binding protein
MKDSMTTLDRRSFLRVSAAGALAGPALATLALPRRAYAKPGAVHVRFGAGSAIAYNPIYVAKEKGFYEEEGLDVELIWAQAAPEVIQAVIGGSAEGGVGGSFGMIAGAEKGAPIITVAIYAYGGERIALAVRTDAGIKTLRDLYGKKVGFQSGAIGQQMFQTMAEIEKLDVSKIDIVFLNNVDMAAAVAAKSVDAIATWEPQPSLLESKGLVKVLQRGGKYLQSPGCVMFGTDYIKKNREAVSRFVKAHFRGCQFIRQNPKEAAAINAKYVKGAVPEVLQDSYKYLVFDPRVSKQMHAELQSDMKFMLSQKKIARAVDGAAIATSTFTDEIEKQFPELVRDLK